MSQGIWTVIWLFVQKVIQTNNKETMTNMH